MNGNKHEGWGGQCQYISRTDLAHAVRPRPVPPSTLRARPLSRVPTHTAHDMLHRHSIQVKQESLLNSIVREMSLTHDHVHEDYREVMPETVLSQTGMENHGKCEI